MNAQIKPTIAARAANLMVRALAERGHVVICAHHHGNIGREPYRPEGFLCWWERTTDLSELFFLDAQTGAFVGHLDLSWVHAKGFSLGGFAAIALAGCQNIGRSLS